MHARTNRACSSGSPPEKVTPPCLPKKRLSFPARAAMASGDISCPPAGFQVSGLWQNLHRSGQPCRNTTMRSPGPSSAPMVSME